jgi:hypothetical protein
VGENRGFDHRRALATTVSRSGGAGDWLLLLIIVLRQMLGYADWMLHAL